MAIDFPGTKFRVTKHFRPGLKVLEKVHVYSRRVASVEYEGLHAGKILEDLALGVAARTPDISRADCSCETHREYTSY